MPAQAGIQQRKSRGGAIAFARFSLLDCGLRRHDGL
jgi:hypothetical protein